MSFPKIRNHWTTVLCLMSPLWGAARLSAQCVQGEQQASIITFQVPGSDITAPFAINNSSAIAGNYSTPTSNGGGFVRAANGAIATFSVPGSLYTSASSINDGGAIAGTFDDSTGLTHGYVRSAPGQITTFNAPVSAQNNVFSAYINAAGTIAGSYGPAYNQPVHGFVRSASGGMTTFDVSGSVSTSPVGINAEGLIVGSWTDSSQATHGFFRLPSGQIVTFDAPGSVSTMPGSVNSGGTISGSVIDKYGNVHQFVRSNGGYFSFYNVPAGNGTAGAVINAVGLLTVEYGDASEKSHGFVLTPDGTQTSFDAPGSDSTYVAAMSDFGVITGLFYKESAGLTYVRFPTCTDKFQTGAYEVSDSGSYYLDGEFYLHGDPSVRLSPQTAGNASQHWQFSGVTGGFRITNLGTGQYVSDQSGVLEQGQVEDLWTLIPVPWGWSIRNNRTGRLLADPAVSRSALTLNGNGSAWQMSAPK